jgi:hypothetical protein
LCEIKNKPYSGYIEKLKEPIELKGRVIRYKPVAKLSGKSGAKKGGMNPVAGPAQVNNFNNNSPFDGNEPIAFIEFNVPESKVVLSYEEDIFYAKLFELKKLYGFDIIITSRNKNNVEGTPEKQSIEISFRDYLLNKKKNDFNKNLNKLIELLKYFKEAQDNKILGY